MILNEERQALEDISVEQAKEIRTQRIVNRRNFMAGLGLAGATAGISLLSGCSGNGSPTVMAASPSETDVLNFALNLEYLEATFYSFATQGIDLPSTLTNGSGAITGNPTSKIAFSNQQTTDIFNEIFFNEMSHVADLQSLIGPNHVARPALNLAAAGPVTSANVLTISRQFEDVGTTAYAGATALLTAQNLAYATQILAVEGFQAGALRLLSIQQSAPFAAADSLDVPTSDPGAAVLAAQGPTAAGGFFATSGTFNASSTVPLALAFTRSTSQILQIVYGAAGQTGVSKGGFFPNGLNGNITTS
ncbi:ferritin-like domain-containing protein [Granulicella sp. S190]|uniref:ferritin-like domain-containing protein n=1 Tax=Granulicella sp. S190 TaxID=1747226 RepID=UPI00131C2ADB|nr:ferritin-like domain-containing protein [Granulicella sp. S190]